MAFFDVDETLLSGRTLESFLMYYLKQEPAMASPERIRELRNDVVRLSRVAFNREYFGLWAGQSAARVREAGRSWFRDAVNQPDFFRANVIERLREHRKNGAHIVLISGSFAAPLQPITEYVEAHALYCTELEVSDSGSFTGDISSAMLGDDKRRAIDDYLARFNSEPESTWGYGDHSSDLPMLEHVRNPVVVGTDATLNSIAAERDWQVLPIEQRLAPRSPKG
ncbi:MAG: HAD-IB family hydrolase [Microbacteriaceae bacterium]|nr:HAD-IB family hydrolase [Microbacteriaceae bacterium]